MSEREEFELWFECDSSWDRSIKEACWEAWQARASADSDGKRNNAEPKPDLLRTAEENRRVNKLMHELREVFLDDDPDAQLPVHRVWHLLTTFEAEVIAANPAKGREQWVNCSDRLPTEADADLNGKVWCFLPERGLSEVTLFGVKEIAFFWSRDKTITHWLPTGLKRPNPPKPQSSGEDERD